MGKFIVLYRSPVSFMDGMKDAAPEQQQQAMAPWMAWFQRCGDQLVDMGGPLANAQTFTASDSASGGSDVVGYSILEADSIEAAHALIEGHPHLDWRDGCSVEVHEQMMVGG